MTDCNTQEDLNMIPVAFICGEIFKKHRFLKRFMAQSSVINFFFCGTGVWTQDLHLESLQLLFFVLDSFEFVSHTLFAWVGFKEDLGLQVWATSILPPMTIWQSGIEQICQIYQTADHLQSEHNSENAYY
jgi:hypothetical protein